MLYWTEYTGHLGDIQGKRKKVDNTIYTFDIETTSYFILHNKFYHAWQYENLSEEEKEQCEFRSCMYIWMFSINDRVYYGRNWEDFKIFIDTIYSYIPEHKICFIHNFAFEFQYLKSIIKFDVVVARKAHKVMKAICDSFNFEFRCSLFLTNCALKYIPKTYNLPVEKLVGDLDYNKIRHSKTKLTEKELGYCENDCLVIYYYIKQELERYERVDKIPLTSTGHVRRELKELVLKDFAYKRKVRNAINTDPHIYNLLVQAFAGGYTHANWIYANTIMENVDSWDFTSSYPYVLVTHKYPSTEFKKCNITRVERMSNRFAYLLVVKFKNLKCRYYNNFISRSKCYNIKNGVYDNGRIMQAEEITTTLTDIDFRFILDTYRDINKDKQVEYEILECYYSSYNYLPKQFIEFVLQKYIDKTKYKNVEGKEVEYNIAKALFNSLYGMSVTNNIRDEVVFYDDEEKINHDNKTWEEIPLTNDEIIKKLNDEKKASFLSFAYGVWVTAYARNNLLRNVIKLDDYVIYCDTDCCKLAEGYNKNIIKEYNEFVRGKINFVSKQLDIDINKYKPSDIDGVEHMLRFI